MAATAGELTLSSAIAYASYTIITATIFFISYRLLLHPLSSYPGPLVAKLTGGYAGLYAIQKRLHIIIWRDHERYGPVVRIGPDRLVFNTATALKDIYQNDRIVKSRHYLSTTRNNIVNVFTAIPNDLHRVKRKVIEPAITDRAMRSFEPIMAGQIDIYLKQVLEASQSSTPSPAVNMTEKTRHLGLDIVGQLAFGYDLGVQTREDNRFIMKAMYFGNFRGNIFHHLPGLSKLYINRIFDYVFYEAREKYWRLVETMIKSRVTLDRHAKPDLYSFVADTLTANPDSIRGSHLWLEALFFLTAGGDTVATAISAVFFYLARNRACYETLAAEIRSSFASASDIKTGPQLAGCAYLRACIHEAMRMSPPIATTLWREQDPTDDQPLVIDGHAVPKGTLFGVNPYALHHNKEYFPEPFAFRPERWLSSEGGGKTARTHDAFAAFSVGPRACAGKAMAYLESSLVLAKTLWLFDFEAAPGKLAEVGGGRVGGTDGRDRPDEFQIMDIFTSRTDGPYLVFRPRGGVGEEIGGIPVILI
ncbi:cytochrome P450 [Bombardia bombarda]|uniref:Cytochrome P450 n=1 Tax=Bombardia bombarda TaxID=252184 RepID=A0AA40CEW3_9PEZI|nr:cytochrome P450 [Bombardia bombarda]